MALHSLPYTPPPDGELPLLYVTPHFLVLEKPAGLLSVPGRGADKQDCMASRACKRYPEALVVHRLDMETSGLLLMARGEEAQRVLSGLFQQRSVNKTYLALIAGNLSPAQGEINLPLICDWPNRPMQKVDDTQGKPALTRFQKLDYYPELDASTVRLHPVTGRSHQLRVHMRELGHPILGDRLYAPPPIQQKASRLMLHAHCLEFVDPFSGEHHRYLSQPPFCDTLQTDTETGFRHPDQKVPDRLA